jgi:hypothetical protein
MSRKTTHHPKNTPFKREVDERRFTFGFISLMREYYDENSIVDPDIFDIDWDSDGAVAEIATQRNRSVDFALKRIEDELDAEDDEERLLQLAVIGWIRDGLLERCHYYSVEPAMARLELLSDYIRDARNTVVKGEIFKLKDLEKKLAKLRKENNV